MNLVDFLMTAKERGGTAEAAELRRLGETAATKYAREGAPVNDTLALMAKEASLNHEQIKRAVEFANNKMFIDKFAQPYDKNIEFPLADADTVSQKISGELTLPKTASIALIAAKPYRPGQEYGSVEQLFGGRSLVKTASAKPQTDFVRERAARAYRHCKDSLGLAMQKHAGLEARVLHKIAELHRTVSQEVRAGEPPWAIGAAIALANPSEELFGFLADELAGSFEYLGKQKTAQMGAEIEPDNPVTGLVQDLQNIMDKLQAQEEHVTQVRQAIDGLLTFLRGPEQTNPTDQLFQDDPNASVQPPEPPPPPPIDPATGQPMQPPGPPQPGGPPQGPPPGR